MADQTNASCWKELPLVLVRQPTAWFDDAIVTNILSRLPVKKLVQSTLVSKHWYSLITDPIFVQAHIDRSISQLAATTTDHYILVTHKGSSDGHMLSIFADNGDYDLRCKVENPIDYYLKTVEIVGSCNGLVCMTDQASPGYAEIVYLFNPVIRKLKTLPPDKDSYILQFFNQEYSISPVLGFGFCEPDKDFRVVRILYLRDPIFDMKVGPAVEVYSLNSGKWRKVMAKLNRKVFRGCNAFVDGCIYWLAAKKTGAPISRVVWFDLKDEVFHEVKMPENCVKVKMPKNKHAGDINLPVNIIRWKGEVAIGDIEPDGLRNYVKCRFWVLKKDHGGGFLWEAKFDLVLPDPLCGIPVGFTWSGEAVISRREENAENTKIVAFNLHDREFKDLAVDGPHTVATCFEESFALFLD